MGHKWTVTGNSGHLTVLFTASFIGLMVTVTLTRLAVWCPLLFSCAQLLLEVGGASVNACSGEAKLTPLHVAARRGLEEHVELLLRHGADVAACSREGETPLNAACAGAERPSEAGRFLRVVQSLLRAGANPRTAGRKRHTPLHNACSNCSPRIVDLLLQHGAQANAENCAGYTPMDCLVQVTGIRGHQ